MNLKAYLSHRSRMQTGDLLLWQSNTMLGRLIRNFSRAEVNHAGLVIRFQQYDQDRVYTLEALTAGIVLRALSERLSNHNGKAWWYPLKEGHNEARKEIGRIALSYVGVEYDYGSLFRQALARVSVDASRLFCSEYVQLAWQIGGVIPADTAIAKQPGELPCLGATSAEERIL